MDTLHEKVMGRYKDMVFDAFRSQNLGKLTDEEEDRQTDTNTGVLGLAPRHCSKLKTSWLFLTWNSLEEEQVITTKLAVASCFHIAGKSEGLHWCQLHSIPWHPLHVNKRIGTCLELHGWNWLHTRARADIYACTQIRAFTHTES